MQSCVFAGVSLPCVPVSTTETLRDSPENGHEVSHVYEIAEAINLLIDAGYSIGCDGELLPPSWIRKAQVEADA